MFAMRVGIAATLTVLLALSSWLGYPRIDRWADGLPQVQAQTSQSACLDALVRAYLVTVGGRNYGIARGPAYAGPPSFRGRVFLDEQGRVVRDEALALKIARTGWVFENIVKNPAIPNYATAAEGLSGTAYERAIRNSVQDLIIRLETEVALGYLKGTPPSPRFLLQTLRTVPRDTVTGLFNSFRNLLLVWSGHHLSVAANRFNRINREILAMKGNLGESRAQTLYQLYLEGQGMYLPTAALVAALLPKTYWALFGDAAKSIVRGLLPILPENVQISPSFSFEFRNAIDAGLWGDKALGKLPKINEYREKKRLVTGFFESIERMLRESAGEATRACPEVVSTPVGQPPAVQPPLVPSSVNRPAWNLGQSWSMQLCSTTPSPPEWRFEFRVVGSGDFFGFRDVYLLERTSGTGERNAWIVDRNLNRLAFYDPVTRAVLIRYQGLLYYDWPFFDGKTWTFEGFADDLRSGIRDIFRGEARVSLLQFQGQIYFRQVRREFWRVGNRQLTINRIEIWDSSGVQVLFDGDPRVTPQGVMEGDRALCLVGHPISALVRRPSASRTASIQPISWLATQPATDCNGPVINNRPWYAPDFDDSIGWSPLELPDVSTIEWNTWNCEGCDRYYRGRFGIDTLPPGAWLAVASDDGLRLYMNGQPVGRWGGACHTGGCVNNPFRCDPSISVALPPINVTSYLRVGQNIIAAHVSDVAYDKIFNLCLAFGSALEAQQVLSSCIVVRTR